MSTPTEFDKKLKDEMWGGVTFARLQGEPNSLMDPNHIVMNINGTWIEVKIPYDAIKQAVDKYVIGEERLPAYDNGKIVGEDKPFSSNMQDHAVFGSGYNTAKREERQSLWGDKR